MTALSSLLFCCFQAFFAAPSRPIPLSRPPFVTNLLHQPVSDLFQFYAAFPLPSRLISFSVTFSLPYCLISFSVTFSLPSRLISFFSASRLCPALFSASFCYFQCIYNTFSLHFPVRSFCPYLLHTSKVFISSSNASLSVDSEVICVHLLR